MKRLITAILASITLCVVVGLPFAPPAQATAPLDGQSPVSTGCQNGAQIAWEGAVRNGSGASIGTVRIMYSPQCGTNWVRAKSSIGRVWVNKQITRYISAQNKWGYFRENENDYYADWSYSMMVYAPGNTPISFSVIFKNSSGTILGGRSGELTS